MLPEMKYADKAELLNVHMLMKGTFLNMWPLSGWAFRRLVPSRGQQVTLFDNFKLFDRKARSDQVPLSSVVKDCLPLLRRIIT